jgi:elongation factor G
MAVTPDRIRNVALVGHNGAGKTMLAEALLHAAGAIKTMGRVEDGSTVSDWEPEEKAHRLSISLALAPFEWHGHKINLIDTPGYADFIREVETALRVVDLAVFVVSAVEGVEPQTEAIWRRAAALGLPRMIFINKLDREHASFERTLKQLNERFGKGIAPLELPIGEETGFRGIADLLTDRAWLYKDGKATEADIPADMETREHEVHDNLLEGIVVADEALLARYLDGDIPSFEELEKCLARGVDDATVFPVVCGSATREIAIDRLANFLCEIGPSPLDRPAVQVRLGEEMLSVRPDPAGEAIAYVFKTLSDPYVGKVSLLKMLSGTVKADDHLHNGRNKGDERLRSLLSVRGKGQEGVSDVGAGDIAAVAKLQDTTNGDVLGPRGKPLSIDPVPSPQALLSTALVAKTKGDEDKLFPALQRLIEEDPSFAMEQVPETHQTVLYGLGETHLLVALERLRRKFGVDVDQQEVRVRYRETITTNAESIGKVKKQTGGHGQFAVAHLRVAPLKRGSGFEFVDEVVGGAIPRQYIPAVQRGIEEGMSDGGPRGFPVIDAQVTCYDGKYHSVDSSEHAFRSAGRQGFKEAMVLARPVVLEPISWVEVTAPVALQGDILGDLSSRRGQIMGTENSEDDGELTIRALVPTSELRRYPIDLRSLSHGRGHFTARHHGYDVLPEALLRNLPPPNGGK